MQVVRLKFVKKFIKLIKITNCVCVAVYVMLLWCALSVYTLHVSKHVISTIIVTDIYVHSLVELKIINKCTVLQLRMLRHGATLVTLCIVFDKLCYLATPFIMKFAVVRLALLLHLRGMAV